MEEEVTQAAEPSAIVGPSEESAPVSSTPEATQGVAGATETAVEHSAAVAQPAEAIAAREREDGNDAADDGESTPLLGAEPAVDEEDDDGNEAEQSLPAEGIPDSVLHGTGVSRKEEVEEWPTPAREPEGFSAQLPSAKGDVTTEISESGAVRVFTCTWNLAGQMPAEAIGELVPANRYHIYAIATQECGATAARSVVNPNKRPWEERLLQALGPHYALVRAHGLAAIHLAVFAHVGTLLYIRDVQSHAVGAGVANRVGNKGAVGVCFQCGETRMLFLSSHLAAHHTGVEKRNANYWTVERELRLPVGLQSSAGSPKVAGLASERFDQTFWLGDLNYRINGTRPVIDKCLELRMHGVLLQNEQLRREQAGGRAFVGFREAPLHFFPTYKLDKGTLTYDTGRKQRIPSWTDRVLFRGEGIEAKEYARNESPALMVSDHLPVYCTFRSTVLVSKLNEEEALAKPPPGTTQSDVCTIV